MNHEELKQGVCHFDVNREVPSVILTNHSDTLKGKKQLQYALGRGRDGFDRDP